MHSEVGLNKRYHHSWLEKVRNYPKMMNKRFGKWWPWIWLMMQLSDLRYGGRIFTMLAGLPLGYFRDRAMLCRIKSYISPKAQISCPDLLIGPHCFIDDFVTIYGNEGRIVLDKRVHLYRGTIVEVGGGGGVKIGEFTQIQPGCNINGYVGQVQIGRKVMVSAGCSFTPYQHKMDDLSRAMADQELTSKGDIVVEDDVWLGMGVRVMDDVRIGQGAVIGANAVVTQNIPPYSIAVGVPARVISKREHKAPPKVGDYESYNLCQR